MPNAPMSPRNQKIFGAVLGVIGLAILGTVVAIVRVDQQAAEQQRQFDQQTGRTPRVTDPAAPAVCRRLDELARDVTAGRTDFAELRPRIQDLAQRGSVATTPEVKASTAALLVAVTADDEPGFTQALDRLVAACRGVTR